MNRDVIFSTILKIAREKPLIALEDLAEELSLPESTVLELVNDMFKEGLIQGSFLEKSRKFYFTKLDKGPRERERLEERFIPPIRSETVTEKPPARPSPDTTRFCNNCGARISAFESYCIRCGTRTSTEPEEEEIFEVQREERTREQSFERGRMEQDLVPDYRIPYRPTRAPARLSPHSYPRDGREKTLVNALCIVLFVIYFPTFAINMIGANIMMMLTYFFGFLTFPLITLSVPLAFIAIGGAMAGVSFTIQYVLLRKGLVNFATPYLEENFKSASRWYIFAPIAIFLGTPLSVYFNAFNYYMSTPYWMHPYAQQAMSILAPMGIIMVPIAFVVVVLAIFTIIGVIKYGIFISKLADAHHTPGFKPAGILIILVPPVGYLILRNAVNKV